ncbi:MAG: GCN5 family acetyltransferase [Bacteroidota bacterium]
MTYPEVLDEEKVGEYTALTKLGGGYVWDEVLEYRVWCHPELGTDDLEDGSDYYYAFASFREAKDFSDNTEGAEEPIALILQKEHINEPEEGTYIHVKEERVTEWNVEWLKRPRRTENTIPDFMSPDAPDNKLDIIRGLI